MDVKSHIWFSVPLGTATTHSFFMYTSILQILEQLVGFEMDAKSKRGLASVYHHFEVGEGIDLIDL